MKVTGANKPLEQLRYAALAARDQNKVGMRQLRQGLVALRDTGQALWRPSFLALLPEACRHAGHIEDGLTVHAKAQGWVDETGERFYEAELYRLKGELLAQSVDNQAETCFHHALDVARHQQAKSLELRAATSLARLWQTQGKRQDAYDLLAPVYEWFTEGSDTADLKEAKTLFETLDERRL